MVSQEEIKQLKNELIEYRKGLHESIQTHICGDPVVDFAWLKLSLLGLFDCCGRIVDILNEE